MTDTIIELGITQDGRLTLYLETNTISTTANYGSAGSLLTGVWSFIAVRFNESDVDVLIDDVWFRSAASGPVEPWDGSNFIRSALSTNLTIGISLDSYIGFDGSLDEIAVFNSTVTDSEIEDHKNGYILKVLTSVSYDDGSGVWTPGMGAPRPSRSSSKLPNSKASLVLEFNL